MNTTSHYWTEPVTGFQYAIFNPEDHVNPLVTHEIISPGQISNYSSLAGALGNDCGDNSAKKPEGLSPLLLETPLPSLPAPSTPFPTSPCSLFDSSTPSSPAVLPDHPAVVPEIQAPPTMPRHYIDEFVPTPCYVDKVHGENRDHRSTGAFAPILFDPESTAIGDMLSCSGTPVAYCLSRCGLRDPYARVFEPLERAGIQRIIFVLMWPGYDEVEWKFEIPIYGEYGLMTRGELAYLIARQYGEFVQSCSSNVYQSSDERWRVGNGGYELERMCLSSLWWTGGDFWQASIRVLTECES